MNGWIKASLVGCILSATISSNSMAGRYVEPYVNAPSWLEVQVVIGELKGDETLADSAIQRWLAVAPNSADALFAKGRWLTRQGDIAGARHIERQLSQLNASSQQRQLDRYIAVHTSEQDAYNRILLLQKGGQYAQALAAFNQLFGAERPDIEYQLAYLDLKSALPQYRQETLRGYQALVRRYPEVAAIEMRLAKHLARYGNEGQAIAIYRRLLSDPNWGLAAASAWINLLEAQPMSSEWFEQVAYVARHYPNNLGIQQQYETAQQNWRAEQQRRRDPLYRGKRALLANLAADRYLASDYHTLQQALAKWPNDPELLVASAQFQYQRKQYPQALRSLRQAQRLDDDPDLRQYYQARIQTVRAWYAIDTARNHLAEGQLNAALTAIDEALAIDPSVALAHSVKGQILLAQGQPQQAFVEAERALALSPESGVALRLWLQTRYPAQGIAGQWQAFNALSLPQQRALGDERSQLLLNYVIDQLATQPSSPKRSAWQGSAGESLSEDSQSKETQSDSTGMGYRMPAFSVLVDEAIALRADLPWQKQALAEQLVRHGERARAEQMMQTQLTWFPNPETAHAVALFFTGLDDVDNAYQAIISGDWHDLTAAQAASFARIKLAYHRNVIAEQALSGAALERYIDDVSQRDLPLAVVLWSENGFADRARKTLGEIDYAHQSESQLNDYSEAAYVLGESSVHQAIVAAAERLGEAPSVMLQRQLALASDSALAKGDYQQAATGYLSLIEQGFTLPVTSLSTLISAQPEYAEPIVTALMASLSARDKEAWIDALSLALQSGLQSDVAQLNNTLPASTLTGFDYWRLHEAALQGRAFDWAQHYAEIALRLDDQSRYQLSEPRSLEAAYRNAGEHWMTQDLIGTLERLRERRSTTLTMGMQWNFDPSGTQTLTAPVELKWAMPPLFAPNNLAGDWLDELGDGHWLLRTETVYVDSGELDFRSPDPRQPEQRFSRHALGQGFGIGWQSERLRWDVGSSPVGFNEQTWVGGLAVSHEFGDWRVGFDLSRRSLTSSFISFAGSELTLRGNRPKSLQWGGVTQTGLSLSASWHDGRPFGGWGFVERHALSGNNVVDNWRNAAMIGGYYTHYARPDAQLSSGVSLFYMGYDKNLGEVAYGHGDYYSPEHYLSLATNVTYLHRFNYDWTAGVRASVSVSGVESGDVYGFDDANERSQSVSGSVELHSEYRFDPHWSLIGIFSQQISSDYQPSILSVFVRYHFDANWQKAALEPERLIPYSEFN